MIRRFVAAALAAAMVALVPGCGSDEKSKAPEDPTKSEEHPARTEEHPAKAEEPPAKAEEHPKKPDHPEHPK